MWLLSWQKQQAKPQSKGGTRAKKAGEEGGIPYEAHNYRPWSRIKNKGIWKAKSKRFFFFLCLIEEINYAAVTLYLVGNICKVSEWLETVL